MVEQIVDQVEKMKFVNVRHTRRSDALEKVFTDDLVMNWQVASRRDPGLAGGNRVFSAGLEDRVQQQFELVQVDVVVVGQLDQLVHLNFSDRLVHQHLLLIGQHLVLSVQIVQTLSDLVLQFVDLIASLLLSGGQCDGERLRRGRLMLVRMRVNRVVELRHRVLG